MNRRAFVKLAGCVAGAVAAFPLLGRVTEKKYGRINVNQHEIARRAHASLDGVEISHRCYEADDVNGYVLCFKEGPDGKAFFDREINDISRERLEGNVRIWVDA